MKQLQHYQIFNDKRLNFPEQNLIGQHYCLPPFIGSPPGITERLSILTTLNMHQLFFSICELFSKGFNHVITSSCTNQDNAIYFAPLKMTSSVSLNRSSDIKKTDRDRDNPPCSIHPGKLQECSQLDSLKYLQLNNFLRSTATSRYEGVFEYYYSIAALFISLVAARRTLFTRIHKNRFILFVMSLKKTFRSVILTSPSFFPF